MNKISTIHKYKLLIISDIIFWRLYKGERLGIEYGIGGSCYINFFECKQETSFSLSIFYFLSFNFCSLYCYFFTV